LLLLAEQATRAKQLAALKEVAILAREQSNGRVALVQLVWRELVHCRLLKVILVLFEAVLGTSLQPLWQRSTLGGVGGLSWLAVHAVGVKLVVVDGVAVGRLIVVVVRVHREALVASVVVVVVGRTAAGVVVGVFAGEVGVHHGHGGTVLYVGDQGVRLHLCCVPWLALVLNGWCFKWEKQLVI